MIEVQWFYKKADLDFKALEIDEKDIKYIADNEVFPSNHFDKVFIDCVTGACQVHQLKQYDNLE